MWDYNFCQMSNLSQGSEISCSAEHADYRQTQKARWNKSSIYQLVLYLTDEGERGTKYNNVYVW